MHKDVRIFIASMFATLLAACAGPATKPEAAKAQTPAFSEAEREVIMRFYGRRAETLPTSARIGAAIEPGARPQHLPTDLHSRLKALPEPYTWYVLGHDVVLVDRNTHKVLDVVPSVVY